MKGYIEFTELLTTRKTELWEVRAKRSSVFLGVILGYIKWYGPWRQYCFHPSHETVFSSGCQDEISAKIKSMMDARRKK